MRFLNKDMILAMHKEMLVEHGGLAGTVDEGSLDSVLARPHHAIAYEEPNIYDLAAHCGFGFAKDHCFTDGNKRVALVAIAVFLRINGLRLKASEAEAVQTILSLASGQISQDELATWIQNYSETG